MLVSNAGAGRGAAVVDRLLREKARVAFTDEDAHRGPDVAERSGAIFITSPAADAARSVREAVAVLGGLDALVMNVEMDLEARLSQTPDSAWDMALEASLITPFRYAAECLPALREAGGGSITVISSPAGAWPQASAGAYSVAARALGMLVQMLAIEGRPHGIRANAVCPAHSAAGAEVAGPAAFFVSADSALCNGAILVVDGGTSAALRAGIGP